MCSNTLDCPLDLQLVMNLRGGGIGAMMRALCYHYHVLGSSPNYVAFSVRIKMPMTEFDLLYFLSNSQSMWIQLFNLPQIITEIINDIVAIIINTVALCKAAISLNMVSLAVCKQWTHNK